VLEGRVCGSLSLSRAFGDYQYKGAKPSDFMVSHDPDITVHEIEQFNLLLIACDGIWEA
jgi:protein phosphatase 1G